MVTCHRNLTPYWIDFDLEPDEAARGAGGLESALDPRRRLARGVGVTAESREAALELVRERYGGEGGLPELTGVIEGVDPADLPPEVRAEAGAVTVRGVWFPG